MSDAAPKAFALILYVAALIAIGVLASRRTHSLRDYYAGGKRMGFLSYVGAVLGCVVVLLYITRGGYIAVVWSDVFQGTLMLVGLVVLPLLGVLELVGVTSLLSVLREQYPTHLSFTAGAFLLSGTVIVLVSRLDPRTVDSPLNASPGSRP